MAESFARQPLCLFRERFPYIHCEIPLPVASPTCPGDVFVTLHPKKSRREPFFDPTPAQGVWHHSATEATCIIGKMTEFDAYENTFPVILHDNSLIGVLEVCPSGANGWLAKGWK